MSIFGFPVAVIFAVCLFAGVAGGWEYAKRRTAIAFERKEVAAADALLAHGVPRERITLHVLARANWTNQNTATVVRETGGDTRAAEQILTGLTRALMFDHIVFPRQRVEIDGVTAWTRLAMHLLDAGVARKDLAKAIEDTINRYDVDLPLRYTAWAYAAGMGREEATARWRTARINMDEVRRIARDNGVNLAAAHAIAAAAA